MRLLRNYESYKEFYDLQEHAFYVLDKPSKIVGFYKKVSDVISAIFVHESKLYFSWNGNNLLLNENTMAEVKKDQSQNKNKFNLLINNELILDFMYETPWMYNEISPFEYIDVEDLDWGLFLVKTINDKEKKKNFIDIHSE